MLILGIDWFGLGGNICRQTCKAEACAILRTFMDCIILFDWFFSNNILMIWDWITLVKGKKNLSKILKIPRNFEVVSKKTSGYATDSKNFPKIH